MSGYETQFNFPSAEFAGFGGTNKDIADLLERVKARGTVDLEAPDPHFHSFAFRRKGQLPSRPKEGAFKIKGLFRHVKLLALDEQGMGRHVSGDAIFKHLRATGAPVLGPNVGEVMRCNPRIIPKRLRGRVLLFWGLLGESRSYRRIVWGLEWLGGRWDWTSFVVGSGDEGFPFGPNHLAVVLKKEVISPLK